MTIVPMVVGYFAIQWNRANFLGKTPEQIVAMGREKWSDLYGKKFGLGTHQVSDASRKYGDAVQNLNDRAMKQLPRTRQLWLNEVRKSTIEYAEEAHRIGAIISGGGSMWQTFNASIYPDVEQTISDCLVSKAVPMVRMKSFESEIAQLDKMINSIKSDRKASDVSTLALHRKGLTDKQSKLLTLLSKGPAGDATRFQMYMHRKIAVARCDDL